MKNILILEISYTLPDPDNYELSQFEITTRGNMAGQNPSTNYPNGYPNYGGNLGGYKIIPCVNAEEVDQIIGQICTRRKYRGYKIADV